MRRLTSGRLAAALLCATLPCLAVSGTASAQSAPASTSDTPKVVHYGKWGAAALFAALTTAGVIEHTAANASYRDLQAYCLGQGSCAIGSDGRYASPQAEQRYQNVVRGDRAARVWLLSGQVALGGAAVLFVMDLLHEHGTKNIPYAGLVVAPGRFGTTRVGFSLPLPRSHAF